VVAVFRVHSLHSQLDVCVLPVLPGTFIFPDRTATVGCSILAVFARVGISRIRPGAVVLVSRLPWHKYLPATRCAKHMRRNGRQLQAFKRATPECVYSNFPMFLVVCLQDGIGCGRPPELFRAAF
jgi:hypothetical protein